ncbi:MAG: magnesium transporter [Halarsenatibacteraceae bacterium]
MEVYDRVIELLENEDVKELKTLLNNEDMVDLMQIMRELDRANRVICYRLLNKDLAMEVFERLDIEVQEELISDFAETEINSIFKELAPDDRVRLLDELPARVAKKLLNNLNKEERNQTSELLGYEDETAGRIMTPHYIRFKRGTKIDEAMKKLRAVGEERETVYNLYVTTDTRLLEGSVSLRDLIMADGDQKIEEIMKPDPIKVDTETDQEEVARLLQEQDLLAVPVVDKENRLVGIITVDDAFDVIEEETTEDIFDKVGINTMNQKQEGRSRVLIEGKLREILKARLPFLLITLIGGFMAGFVIQGFEASLKAVAAIAVFIPVVMDMGGNVGTQSSTIFSRALVLGQINVRNFMRHLFKEMLVGLNMGTIIGIIGGLVAHLWQGIEGFGIAVALSLAITITLASSLGFIIPFILFKLDFDQAAGADPIIITIKGITGLFIYFYLVNFFLGNLMG